MPTKKLAKSPAHTGLREKVIGFLDSLILIVRLYTKQKAPLMVVANRTGIAKLTATSGRTPLALANVPIMN